MTPHPWTGVLLALAVYRLCRLIGWDDLPPIARVRAWVTGELVGTSGSSNARMGLTREPVVEMVTYKRPLLAHFLHCSFCVGFWLSLLAYVAWIEWPTATMYVAVPLAVNAAAALLAKNLDP